MYNKKDAERIYNNMVDAVTEEDVRFWVKEFYKACNDRQPLPAYHCGDSEGELVKYNGKHFVITGPVWDNEPDIDLESLPMWHITFDDGLTSLAFEDEIFGDDRISKNDNACENAMDFDVALIEKEVNSGLTKEDISKLLDMLGEKEVYPIEIYNPSGESSAMGFITSEAAEKTDFDYERSGYGISHKIGEILSDMNKESDDGIYELTSTEGIKIKVYI